MVLASPPAVQPVKTPLAQKVLQGLAIHQTDGAMHAPVPSKYTHTSIPMIPEYMHVRIYIYIYSEHVYTFVVIGVGVGVVVVLVVVVLLLC